jgi:hypothetical protein
MEHEVALVLDPDSDRLPELSRRMHVWARDTTSHRSVAAGLGWEGITVFYMAENDTVERRCVEALGDIHLHHAGWKVLEVYGCPISPAIRSGLDEFGFDGVTETDGGFVASRP